LQKYIADSGYWSRRQAERLIREGRVKVNGKPAELGMRVGPKDKTEINGRLLEQKKEPVYIALNKPKGYTCTNRKFRNEKNVFELLDASERLFCVGRLDKDSRGLVLLTNDGELAQQLTHPGFRHEKKYLVKVKEEPADAQDVARRLEKGVTIKDERKQGEFKARAVQAKYLGQNKFEVVITEGKKRQVRKMLAAAGLSVKDLQRTGFAGLRLGELEPGHYRKLDTDEIKLVRHSMSHQKKNEACKQ